MRHLPHKLNEKQKRIISAVLDYFGPGASHKEKKDSKKIALFLMGRRRDITLSENEKSIVWAIRCNLERYSFN